MKNDSSSDADLEGWGKAAPPIELDPATVTVDDVIRSPIIFLQLARDHGSARITFRSKAESVRFYNRVRALIHVRGDELLVAARRDGLAVIAGKDAIPEADLEVGAAALGNR